MSPWWMIRTSRILLIPFSRIIGFLFTAMALSACILCSQQIEGERKQGVLDVIFAKFKVHKLIDFSYYENEDHFLEGTGSMVLDRDDRIAYACVSPRTNKKVLQDFCKTMGYKGIVFHAVDENKQQIYHTNVMMCVAEQYVLICLDAVHISDEKEELAKVIKQSGKKLIEITAEQMNQFAGNMLQINNSNAEAAGHVYPGL